jgi:cyclic pyranopterin phosphate synthase
MHTPTFLTHAIQQRLPENAHKEITKHVSEGLIDIDALNLFFSKAEISNHIQELKEMQFLRITAYPGCNLRCSYCNPEGLSSGDTLTTREILDIVKAAHELGIRTVHYTGGEPTERLDFVELVRATKKIGMTTIDVTTNGTNLNRPIIIGRKEYGSMIEALYASGLTGVSLSLDSLNPETFKKMALSKNTIIDANYALSQIKKAIEKTCCLFKISGKFVVNMVVTKLNFHEIQSLLIYAQELDGGFVPRFCELQNKGPAYGEHQDKFYANYITRESIIQTLENIGMGKLQKLNRVSIDKQNAHAEYYALGRDNLVVGIVAPFSQGWPCPKADCSRIRIGPTGAVNSCLESRTYQLKDKSLLEKKEVIKQVIYQKILRILNDDWPKTHGTDYLSLRFGLEKNQK